MSDGRITLPAAAPLIASDRRAAGFVSPVSVWRYVKHGVRRPDGSTLRLRAELGPAGCYLTKAEWVAEFLAARGS